MRLEPVCEVTRCRRGADPPHRLAMAVRGEDSPQAPAGCGRRIAVRSRAVRGFGVDIFPACMTERGGAATHRPVAARARARGARRGRAHARRGCLQRGRRPCRGSEWRRSRRSPRRSVRCDQCDAISAMNVSLHRGPSRAHSARAHFPTRSRSPRRSRRTPSTSSYRGQRLLEACDLARSGARGRAAVRSRRVVAESTRTHPLRGLGGWARSVRAKRHAVVGRPSPCQRLRRAQQTSRTCSRRDAQVEARVVDNGAPGWRREVGRRVCCEPSTRRIRRRPPVRRRARPVPRRARHA